MSNWNWIVEINAAHDWGGPDPEIRGTLVAYFARSEGQSPPPLPRAGQRFKLVPDDVPPEETIE